MVFGFWFLIFGLVWWVKKFKIKLNVERLSLDSRPEVQNVGIRGFTLAEFGLVRISGVGDFPSELLGGR